MKPKYSDKLKNPKWQKKRLDILTRDQFTCHSCKTTDIELHIHHIEYKPGEPWDIDNSLLITLCRDCHKITEDMGGGSPPGHVFWKDGREYAIVYHENYISYIEKGNDIPIWQFNEWCIRLVFETIPDGWLDSARKHSDWILVKRHLDQWEKDGWFDQLDKDIKNG